MSRSKGNPIEIPPVLPRARFKITIMWAAKGAGIHSKSLVSIAAVVPPEPWQFGFEWI